MAKPKKIKEETEKVDIVPEVVKEEKPAKVEPVKKVVDPEIAKLREITELEKQIESKKEELYDIRVSNREEKKQAKLSDCLKFKMRDDQNSQKKNLAKIVKAGQAQLNRMK